MIPEVRVSCVGHFTERITGVIEMDDLLKRGEDAVVPVGWSDLNVTESGNLEFTILRSVRVLGGDLRPTAQAQVEWQAVDAVQTGDSRIHRKPQVVVGEVGEQGMRVVRRRLATMAVAAFGFAIEQLEPQLFLRGQVDLTRDVIVVLGVKLGELVSGLEGPNCSAELGVDHIDLWPLEVYAVEPPEGLEIDRILCEAREHRLFVRHGHLQRVEWRSDCLVFERVGPAIPELPADIGLLLLIPVERGLNVA